MSIVNRRNAVFGWALWKVSKNAMMYKARGAKPAVKDGRPNKPMMAAAATGAATAVGALTVWRRRHGADGDS